MEIKENWVKEAKVDKSTYEAKYKNSIEENDSFWKEEGKRIDWIKDYTKIKTNKQLTVIGHVTDDPINCNLINLKGEQIKLVAQGWKNFEK